MARTVPHRPPAPPRAVARAAKDAARAQLWPLPVAAVVLAVAVGLLLPQWDTHVDGSLPTWLDGVVFGGDPDAGRTLLSAVASSLITVTSLTFSLTVVTLQLASSQFSPRLLRTFTGDVFVQATLGLFLATFGYSLTVLRAVRTGGDTAAPFVPRLSVTLAFLLAVASVIGLVLFLAHLARRIRVETMLRDVHQGARATVRSVLGEPGEPGGPGDGGDGRDPRPVPSWPAAAPHATPVLAPGSGFVVAVDAGALVAAATRADAVVVLDAAPGDSVVRDVPVGAAWGRAGRLGDDAHTDLRRAVAGAVRVGYERTAAQDVGYGLRQLTDVASKALSPGVNDPTTAVHALGHISALLCELAAHDLGPALLHDDDGVLRAALRRPDLAELVDVAITQPRRYGAAEPQVLVRLFGLLRELAWRCPPAGHDVVRAQLERVRATAAAQDRDDVERRQLADAAHGVERALDAHRPGPA